MIKYTTPSITLTVEGKDLSEANVYVTIGQYPLKITKTGTDLTVTTSTHNQITDTNIVFALSQEETAAFLPGRPVGMQVNWIWANGIRDASDIFGANITGNLLDEVIEP